MSCDNYNELKSHLGHNVKIVWYGDKKDPANVAIECHTCHVVLLDFDKEENS